jgi:hypothetical protein
MGNPPVKLRFTPIDTCAPQIRGAAMIEYHVTNRDILCYAESNGNGTYSGRVAIAVRAGPYSDRVVREWPNGENFRSPKEAARAAMRCAQRAYPPQRPKA